jgi:hypothetical protein
MSADQIKRAEEEVVRHKATVTTALDLLVTKARRTVGSPVAGRSTNRKHAKSTPGTWSLVLHTANLLVPLFRITRPPRQETPDAARFRPDAPGQTDRPLA